jgi:streptogramin lyase
MRHATRRTGRALLVGALLAAMGCDGAGAREDVGSLSVALTVAPADALCLRLTLDFDNGAPNLVTTKTPSQTAATANAYTLANLPLGTVGITADAFGVACTSLTATTPATWVADRTTVVLAPDYSPAVSITLRRTGRVNVGVDFAAGATFEEVKLPAPPAKIVASGASMLLSLPTVSQIWTATAPLDGKLFAVVNGGPRYLTVAADGTVFTATIGTTQVVPITSAGVLKAPIPLTLQPSDLLVDAANTVWVASFSTPQVVRIATATTTPGPAQVIATPGSATPGLALAADGSIRAVAQPNLLLSIPANGLGLTQLGNLNPIPRDLLVASDGTIWFSSTMGAAISKVVGSASVNVFPGTGQGDLVSTSKGIVAGIAGSQLALVMPSGGVQIIQLPDNAQVAGLGVSSTGKVWVADANKPRAIIVTLP